MIFHVGLTFTLTSGRRADFSRRGRLVQRQVRLRTWWLLVRLHDGYRTIPHPRRRLARDGPPRVGVTVVIRWLIVTPQPENLQDALEQSKLRGVLAFNARNVIAARNGDDAAAATGQY